MSEPFLSDEEHTKLDNFIHNLHEKIISRKPLSKYEEDLNNKSDPGLMDSELKKQFIKDIILKNTESYNKFKKYLDQSSLIPGYEGMGTELTTYRTNVPAHYGGRGIKRYQKKLKSKRTKRRRTNKTKKSRTRYNKN